MKYSPITIEVTEEEYKQIEEQANKDLKYLQKIIFGSNENGETKSK